VVQAPNIPGSKALSPVQDLHLTLFGNVPQDKSSQFIGHFFSTFLATNDFAAGPLDLETIISKFQESPSLYHAVVSVGALDISRRLPSSSRTEQKASRVGALTAYRTSINNFRAEIEDNRLLPNDACLWTTIFLGIFEVRVFSGIFMLETDFCQLMYDDSGKGWIKHMLYGTSKIIQLRGPESHLFGPGKSFFLTVRVFEICRSLLFSEPTFLSEPGWRSLMSQMREIDPSQHWHPKEELFDLMILCSDLSLR
jgi:hypothetical protein